MPRPPFAPLPSSRQPRRWPTLTLVAGLLAALVLALVPAAAGPGAGVRPAAAQVAPACTGVELVGNGDFSDVVNDRAFPWQGSVDTGNDGGNQYVSSIRSGRLTQEIPTAGRDGATLRLTFDVRTAGSNVSNTFTANFQGQTLTIQPDDNVGQFVTRQINLTLATPAPDTVTLYFAGRNVDLDNVSVQYTACPRPLISGLNDIQTVEDGGPVSTTFTVGDDETPADQLIVTVAAPADSSPSGTMTVTGTGATRTLTWSGPPNYYTIFSPPYYVFELFRVTVSDGTNSVSQVVAVNVTPVNDPVSWDTATLPGDITVAATGPDGATASFAPTATDVDAFLYDEKSPAYCFYAPLTQGNQVQVRSGETVFPIGTTDLTCRAFDLTSYVNSYGHESIFGSEVLYDFSVTVTDDTVPSISPGTVPGTPTQVGGETINVFPATVLSPDASTVPVTWPPITATDEIDGTVTATCDPASGSEFGVGDTRVTCVAEDPGGNDSQPVTFIVRVADGAAPVVTVPASAVYAEATSPAGATATFTVSAVDAIDPAPVLTCLLGQTPVTADTVFPPGDSIVSCSAVDASGNRSVAQTFVVRVGDSVAPVLALPSAITAEATGPSGAPVSYVATASDAATASVAPSCVPAAGSTFPLGTTPVECVAVDGFGNRTEGEFPVTVVDTTAPAFPAGALPDQTVAATGRDGAVVTYTLPRATDLVDTAVAVTCEPASGTRFALDTTEVACTATDDATNRATGTFDVTVTDQGDPSFTGGLTNRTAAAVDARGATVTYALPTASDTIDPDVAVTCDPPSGARFPLGQTTVTCTARDDAGNDVTGTFTVTVTDQGAPAFVSLPNVTAAATDPQGAIVSYALPAATDAVDSSVTVTCVPPPGSRFALGTTRVDCTARDDASNTATGSFTVTVTDQAAPVFTGIPNVTVPATSSYGAVVSYAMPTATDNVSVPTVSCLPAPGGQFAIGTTRVDCTARDAAGNTTAGSFTVTVTPNGYRDPRDPRPGASPITQPPPTPTPRPARPPRG